MHLAFATPSKDRDDAREFIVVGCSAKEREQVVREAHSRVIVQAEFTVESFFGF